MQNQETLINYESQNVEFCGDTLAENMTKQSMLAWPVVGWGGNMCLLVWGTENKASFL